MSILSDIGSFFNPTTALLRIGSILLVISLVTSAYLYVEHLRDEVKDLQGQVDKAVAANKQQQGVIDDVNRQVSAWQQEAASLQKQLTEKQNTAKTNAQPYYNASKNIQNQINPKDTANQLQKIDDLMNSMIP
jgi:chromosome segregation ATPase